MTANINNALSAYQNALNRIGNTAASNKAEEEISSSAQGSFSQLVRESVSSFEQTTKQSEELSMKAMIGQADIQDVVTAVSNAEIALETVVSVRDKMISAYKEIMQMPM